MIVALASLAAVLLSAPPVAVRFTRRVHPRDWTRWSLAALVVGAVAAEAALVLFSLPTVLRALGAHALVAACARMTGSLMPGGPVVVGRCCRWRRSARWPLPSKSFNVVRCRVHDRLHHPRCLVRGCRQPCTAQCRHPHPRLGLRDHRHGPHQHGSPTTAVSWLGNAASTSPKCRPGRAQRFS